MGSQIILREGADMHSFSSLRFTLFSFPLHDWGPLLLLTAAIVDTFKHNFILAELNLGTVDGYRLLFYLCCLKHVRSLDVLLWGILRLRAYVCAEMLLLRGLADYCAKVLYLISFHRFWLNWLKLTNEQVIGLIHQFDRDFLPKSLTYSNLCSFTAANHETS